MLFDLHHSPVTGCSSHCTLTGVGLAQATAPLAYTSSCEPQYSIARSDPPVSGGRRCQALMADVNLASSSGRSPSRKPSSPLPERLRTRPRESRRCPRTRACNIPQASVDQESECWTTFGRFRTELSPAFYTDSETVDQLSSEHLVRLGN